MLTQCSNCGDTSIIMPVGNGCHTCQRGIMLEITSELNENKSQTKKGKEIKDD